jgi:hypothetical protein
MLSLSRWENALGNLARHVILDGHTAAAVRQLARDAAVTGGLVEPRYWVVCTVRFVAVLVVHIGLAFT